jgi:CHASE3 domain sensor protein
MNDWKIGTRISAGFGLVILIAIALGFFAFSGVGKIEHCTDTVATESLPQMYLIGQIAANHQANKAA